MAWRQRPVLFPQGPWWPLGEAGGFSVALTARDGRDSAPGLGTMPTPPYLSAPLTIPYSPGPGLQTPVWGPVHL